MYRYDYKDMVGGALLLGIGAAVSAVAILNYPLGTLARMGPGMFPAILGVVLGGLGLLIVLQAFRRTGEAPDIRVFSPLFVLGGVASFAILIPTAGLIPAILGVTVISSLAELKIRAASLFLLCLALCLLAPLVFVVGLGLPIPLARWPF
jgi:hypothetical protein